MIKNPFDQKTVSKELFAVYMPAAENKRSTRKFLRKMARHISHGFEIGLRDGRAGKQLPPLDTLLKSDASPLVQDVGRRAYMAYLAGFLEGGMRK